MPADPSDTSTPAHPSGFALASVGTRDHAQPALPLAAFGRDPSRLRQSAGGFGEAARSAGVAGRVAGAECKANPSRVPITTMSRPPGLNRGPSLYESDALPLS